MEKIAIHLNTRALGDTIAGIPTIRKVSLAYGVPITVFSNYPDLFIDHPFIKESLHSNKLNPTEYKVYETFEPLLGAKHEGLEFRHNNSDIRQFHAMSLGFSLTEDEMETDLYIESPKPLPYKNYVLIHPTHTWASRTWGKEKWQFLIDKLNADNIPVVAIGKDSSETGFFNTQKPVMDINVKLGVNLLNDPSVGFAELRWMMNNEAKTVVTMDSGILHLAGTTNVNILQLGSSIHPRLRAPYRNKSQNYKYHYIPGTCREFCSSNMKYNIKEWGSIMGVPPLVKCLLDKPTFECHPQEEVVYSAIKQLYNS